MYENLLKIVTNLGSPKVLVAGDFMLDTYVYGDAVRISPEAPVPILKVTRTDFSCGGAASVVMDLAELGAKPYCLGVIGADQNADLLKSKLSSVNANIDGLMTIDDRPTINKQRLIGLAQHRHQQQLFRIDSESTEPLTQMQYEQVISYFESVINEVDLVCLQDYNKGLLTEQTCRKLIELAAKANKKVLVDPAMIKDYSKYAGSTLITPNRQEASTAVGFEIESQTSAAKAARQLKKDLNLQAVVITMDKEGAFLQTDGLSKLIPTRPRNVYDVTGAGDMVLATLAATIAAGCDYETAVQISNITGGIEVEKFGVATVSIQEIINEVISFNRGKNGKIRTIDLLMQELSWHRSQKETVVFTNGCFDVLHRGHIEYLNFCKSQGDVVVVGLNSDNSVRQIKGPQRPINNQNDRAAVLAAMESIDYITIFDDLTPTELIKTIKPDILIKGEDWAQKGVVGREIVEAYGGKVVLAKFVEGKSSTSTIEKMKELEKNSQ